MNACDFQIRVYCLHQNTCIYVYLLMEHSYSSPTGKIQINQFDSHWKQELFVVRTPLIDALLHNENTLLLVWDPSIA